MCGITTYFSYDSISSSIIDKLQACNQEMRYRGPDENDIWHNGEVAMAHVRLSIIGVANGHQPIFNEDKTLVLICNGEIYNYTILKKELEEKGHVFSTQSDCETIVHLYEEYGESLNDKIDGMFAYCLYDINCKKLIAARDHAGKKPLYFAELTNGIVFSSELKVITENFITQPELNYEILRQTQKYSYSISAESTYVKQIKKIPSGNLAVISRQNGIRINRYFHRNIIPTYRGNYETACKRIKELFFSAVEKRLQSEVPVAILLSAGIDSSAIACVAKELGHEVHVITAGYTGNYKVDERNDAKRLCDEKGFIWHEVELNAFDFKNLPSEIFPRLDEPNGDVAMFAQWMLYEKAKKLGFKVLLSGNGGDELFYGYKLHNNYAKGLNYIKKVENAFPIRSLKNVYKLIKQAPDFFKNFRNINISNTYSVYKELELLAEKESIALEREDWHRINLQFYIDKVYYFLHYAWLTNNCYFLADKLAMAHSIEIRCPFADKELISFIDSLPLEYKYRNNKPKELFKNSMLEILPDYVLYRKKTGFTPPYSFINEILEGYTPSLFKEKPTHFSQFVTDHFAANLLK